MGKIGNTKEQDARYGIRDMGMLCGIAHLILKLYF